METFTQELNTLLDCLHALEQKLSRTHCFTGREMQSWELLSEAEQMLVLQLGNDISVVCHHLRTYSEELPDRRYQAQSPASTGDTSESAQNTQP